VRDIEPEIEIEQFEDEGAPAIPAAALATHAARVALRRQTDRDIWGLTWPVILSGALGSAISLIDIAMVGRLGTGALAAVGYSMQFFFLSMSVFMAVGTACVAQMSRAIGAQQPDRARHALAGCLVLSFLSAGAISAIGFAFPVPLLRLLNAEDAVIVQAIPYLQLILSSSLIFALTFTFESAFRAARDTRTPMIVAFAVTVAKVVLNFGLIFGMFGLPAMGLVGAGLATLLAQGIAAVLIFWLSRRPRAPEVLRLRLRDFADARDLLPETLRLSLPAVAERVVMNAGMMSYFALLGTYGAEAVAAYTVGVRILSFSWIPGMGFSTAAATLVGQALGAGEPRQAARAGWRSARLCLIASAGLGIAFVLGRETLARLFVPNDPAVVEAMGPFMLMLGIAQPFLALHFTLGGALRGAGDTVTPLWAAILGNWALRVPLAYLAAFVLDLEVFWVWLTIPFDHLLRSAWMTWAFWRGRWQENRF
jgi:putative MATE family efflux protein